MFIVIDGFGDNRVFIETPTYSVAEAMAELTSKTEREAILLEYEDKEYFASTCPYKSDVIPVMGWLWKHGFNTTLGIATDIRLD